MAVDKIIRLITELDDKGLEQLESGLKKVENQQKKVEVQSEKTSKGLKSIGENGGAIAILDTLTGGLATKVRDAAEASKLFNVSLKGTKTALIATGIGAFVVALGLVVAYWDDIVDFITGANKQLEIQRGLIQENLTILNSELSLLEKQIKFNDDRNISNKENLKNQKELLLEKKKLIQEDLKILEAQLLKEQSVSSELTFLQKFQKLTGLGGNVVVVDEEQIKRVNDLRAIISKLKEEAIDVDAALDPQPEKKATKDREKIDGVDLITPADIEKQNQLLIDGLEKRFEIRKNAELTLQELAKKSREDFVNDERTKTAITLEEQKKRDEDAKKGSEISIKYAEAEKQAKIGIAQNTLALISEVAGKGSKVGKAVALAQATISGIQGVQNAYTTAQKSPITVGFPAYPAIQAGLAGAFSLLQIKKILSTDPTGKTAPNLGGGGGGGGGISAPSFNTVGTSGVNQLAESLQQDQQPVQAYVVGSNVTTQQELDRNIVDTVSLG